MLSAEDIKTICICGAGTMGSGIAQLSAMAGFQTIQFDVQAAMLEKSRMSIEQALQKLLEKNKITAEEKQRAVSNITFTTNIAQCKADVIIEAIVEKKEAKIGLFNQLAAINNGEAVLATNTSSISVSEIASATASASKVAGMHFFNPAPLMKLVEVVRANDTSGSVIEILVAVARKMGKVPVVCKDSPGFIVNRVARHYYLESMWLVEQGLATIEAVDAIMESTGFKMGPFKLMDLIGMDVNYAVSNIVWESLGKPERLTPSPLQKRKVDAGEFGRKTGKGFYQY
ncbi:MAG TPA: 3-hydroxyacyl-CoA dehydrogenase NAD-binding domain-containing protein [Panacibacter sp.]|nr:3-hydroxyacyl-CoA dehydrogenase NAD-binding domain-containing protein [Panacibacter sp.]HNP44715.1 3-hydroxyacyl-CoA dehydrogenase NAD-binding domain-containing protein [Panacibacter sp.]